MEITAKLNYLRIAPRKMRLLVDLIRGEKIEKAITLLDFSIKKGSGPLKKVLEQAVANAENNFQLEKSSLYISKITIDEGPKLKRWRARARGRAARIEKKTSHVTLVLSEVKEMKKIAARFQKPQPEAGRPLDEVSSKNKKKETKISIILPEVWENVIRAGRNIPYLNFLQVKQLNTYEVLNGGMLVFTKESIEALKESSKFKIQSSKLQFKIKS